MEKDLLIKIENLLDGDCRVSEDQVRSLMILVRKRLELEPEPNKTRYSTLNLFCNWAAHTKITQSMTGLKILARINDALVTMKNSTGMEVQTEMSRAIGFDVLHSEFVLFLQNVGVSHKLSEKQIWAAFLGHLIVVRLCDDASDLWSCYSTHDSAQVRCSLATL